MYDINKAIFCTSNCNADLLFPNVMSVMPLQHPVKIAAHSLDSRVVPITMPDQSPNDRLITVDFCPLAYFALSFWLKTES
jgi:hypothetical protein